MGGLWKIDIFGGFNVGCEGIVDCIEYLDFYGCWRGSLGMGFNGLGLGLVGDFIWVFGVLRRFAVFKDFKWFNGDWGGVWRVFNQVRVYF